MSLYRDKETPLVVGAGDPQRGSQSDHTPALHSVSSLWLGESISLTAALRAMDAAYPGLWMVQIQIPSTTLLSSLNCYNIQSLYSPRASEGWGKGRDDDTE